MIWLATYGYDYKLMPTPPIDMGYWDVCVSSLCFVLYRQAQSCIRLKLATSAMRRGQDSKAAKTHGCWRLSPARLFRCRGVRYPAGCHYREVSMGDGEKKPLLFCLQASQKAVPCPSTVEPMAPWPWCWWVPSDKVLLCRMFFFFILPRMPHTCPVQSADRGRWAVSDGIVCAYAALSWVQSHKVLYALTSFQGAGWLK